MGGHRDGKYPKREQRKSVKGRPPRRKKLQKQRVMNLLQSLLPILLHYSGGGGRENQGEVQPGKKGGLGEDALKIWFYFSLSYSGFIGNKTGFPELSSFHP